MQTEPTTARSCIDGGSQLGGRTTTGGVSLPGLFHAWGRQIVAGIGWELVVQAVALDGGVMPDFSQPPKRHWHHQVQLNGPLYAALAEEACLGSGKNRRSRGRSSSSWATTTRTGWMRR